MRREALVLAATKELAQCLDAADLAEPMLPQPADLADARFERSAIPFRVGAPSAAAVGGGAGAAPAPEKTGSSRPASARRVTSFAVDPPAPSRPLSARPTASSTATTAQQRGSDDAAGSNGPPRGARARESAPHPQPPPQRLLPEPAQPQSVQAESVQAEPAPPERVPPESAPPEPAPPEPAQPEPAPPEQTPPPPPPSRRNLSNSRWRLRSRRQPHNPRRHPSRTSPSRRSSSPSPSRQSRCGRPARHTATSVATQSCRRRRHA